MESVGTLLSSIFKSLGIEDKIKLADLQNSWHTLLNKPLTLHTYPVDLKDGELVINVDSPSWIGELKFFKKEIIHSLRTYGIKDVKFRYGKVYKKRSLAKDPKKVGKRDRMKRSLSSRDVAWVEQIVANISDIALREEVKKAILKQMETQGIREK